MRIRGSLLVWSSTAPVSPAVGVSPYAWGIAVAQYSQNFQPAGTNEHSDWMAYGQGTILSWAATHPQGQTYIGCGAERWTLDVKSRRRLDEVDQTLHFAIELMPTADDQGMFFTINASILVALP